MLKRCKRYTGIFRSWIGSTPHVNLSKPEYAEIILNNSIHIDKSTVYDYMKPWLGEGLLTSTGRQWQSRRKLLTPAFHFRMLDDSLKIFDTKAQLLIKQLNKLPVAEVFDMYPYITHCSLDIICGNHNHHCTRHPFTFINIFNRVVEAAMGVDVIRERRHQILKTAGTIVDGDETAAEKKTFLDILIEASKTDATLGDEDIRQEVDTFLFEGHDTLTAAVCWCIFLLGNHLDVQERVYEEIQDTFRNHEGPVNAEILGKLKLLERCIKETLRLYPSVPIVARQLQKDIDIGGYVIPASSTVNLYIYVIHRDPRYYNNPEAFDPDRFLPENIREKHHYAYIPFSAGPRNCIGQKYAMLEAKVLLTYILMNFKIKSVETEKTVRPIIDLILRPLNGLPVTIERRHFQKDDVLYPPPYVNVIGNGK
ncbi:cytochrome p450 family 4 [Holotrichia oblita]|uniref:Cytochrome p450 family 4 n=1 Tax=Holotrichia oblita TaxID=644536 RepID=A0ACB9TIM2_HOLOL|nr:cytochrome p450 family 4 [Holotrichia oblita]